MKPSMQSEIAIFISPASTQQIPILSPENFSPMQNSYNSNFSQSPSIPNTENLDSVIQKLKEIETLLTNIINLANNPAIPLNFLKDLVKGQNLIFLYLSAVALPSTYLILN